MKKIILNIKIKEEIPIINKTSIINEIPILNELFLGKKTENGEKIRRNIIKKLKSYKSQDLKKDRYYQKDFISYEQVLEKLVISKLKCYYCKCIVRLIYTKKLDNVQWSLDRVNNSECHSNINTVISCLGCNLQKRCRDKDKFKFTKQMRIIKSF